MHQTPPAATADPAAWRQPPGLYPLTNPREVAGFLIAHLVRVGGFFLLGFIGVLTPLYAWAFRTGHGILLTAVSSGVSVIAALIMLPLFLAARGGLGGTPPMISGVGGDHRITSTGAEIGAYLLAELIGIVALMVLNALILSPWVYGPLHRSGHTALMPVTATTIGLVIAAVVLLTFVCLRRVFTRSPGIPGQ